MPLRLAGIGTATPPRQIAQGDAAELASGFTDDPDLRRTLAAVYRQTRIRFRGSVLLDEPGREVYAQSFFPPVCGADFGGPTTAARMARYAVEAGPLAIRAARGAIAAAGISADQVSHLITCSCTGFASPGVDIELIAALGLAAGTSRTHVGFMGCHGAFNALRVADAFVRGDSACVPLVVCVELCSLHFQYGDRSDVIVANSIFADGAAAVVGSSLRSAVVPSGWSVHRQWSRLLPDSGTEMGWTIGDHGFNMSLAASVPATVGRSLPALVDACLAEVGLSRRDVASWAVHPGGPRVLAGVEQALDLPPEALAASRGVLADHGNMSSGTILFILERIVREGGRCPCMAMAFGPGLTVELAVFVSP